jgi:hypothetical protein
VAGALPARTGLRCEVEHNGDGLTSSTPHCWVSFGRTSLRMVKLAWAGTYTGWSGPTAAQTIRSTVPALDYAAARWDGKQWLMAVISPDDAQDVRIYQRNQANTTTVTYDTPAHPQGNIRYLAVNYDNTTKDIRVYAVGTTTADVWYVDYTRASSAWNSWATVTGVANLGPADWGVRAGGTAGNSRFDVITAVAGSPNTVQHTPQSTSSAPNLATWTTTGLPYLNGGAANVNAGLTLDWVFTDVDAGQTQGSYALSRQIGAGTVNYWNAGTGLWQGTEVQNATATTAVTLPSGWGANADANHAYRVKVWDSTNVPAPGYSAQMVIVPSVLVQPTITAPTPRRRSARTGSRSRGPSPSRRPAGSGCWPCPPPRRYGPRTSRPPRPPPSTCRTTWATARAGDSN